MHKFMKAKFAAILLLVVFSPFSRANLFRNAYVSFELPPNWNCNLEGTEWVCISQYSQRSKEAIIILTAKEVGPTDTFQAYMEHLKTPRTIPGPNGKPTTSKIYQVSQRQISNHPWIDGMHLGSEVSSYYTRYLATIKDRIAILVTFSAHKLHYTKYSNDFLKAIQSLRVVASKDLLDNRRGAVRGAGETLGGPVDVSPVSAIAPENFPDEDSSLLSGNTATYLGLLIIAAALGVYFYLKTSKSGGKKSSKRNSGSGKGKPH
jgi:hypothetical protein